MNITRIALDNSRMTWVALAMVICLGLIVYADFPSREDPVVRISRAVISTQFPGLPPEQVESLISKKIEEKLRELGDVEHITSTSLTGQSIVSVQAYQSQPDFDKVWDKVRRKLEDVKPLLPQGTQGPFLNDDYGDVAIVTAALTGDGWSMAELRERARAIRDRLYTVEGIRRVTLYGVPEEKVYLEAPAAMVEAQGISLSRIVQAVQDQNHILPAGQVMTERRYISVETSGKLNSVRDLEQVQVAAEKGQGVLPLKDYLSVRSSYGEPPRELAFFNGREAIVIAASMQQGRNILELGPRLKQFLQQTATELPVGMQLQLATFQPEVVDEAISSVKGSLYQTLFIVLGVVVLALGVSEGLIVGLTVPLTILLTLLVMFVLEIDLQFISLASLIIALGMLVDNGIVVAENIHLRLHRGEERYQAALSACKELALPLLTSTLTTVLAFAPILMANSASGEYTRSLAQVVSISLLASWLISLTIVPLMAMRFIRVKSHDKPFFLLAPYRRLLGWLLVKPKSFLLGIAAVFIGALLVTPLIPVEMFAVSSRSEVLVYLDMPSGYNVHQTRDTSQRLSRWLMDKEQNPDVEYVSAYIGTGGPRFFLSISPNDPAPHRAFMIVNTRSAEAAAELVKEIRHYVGRELPEAFVRTELIARGTVPPGVVQLRFSGPDSDKLYAMAREAERALAAIPGAIHVHNNWENRTKRYRITVDEARARRAGVTYEAISRSLQSVFGGTEITEIRRGETLIPVIFKPRESMSAAHLLDRVKVYLPGENNEYIRLSQVADIEEVSQFGSIVRRDLEKTVTVEGKHLSWKAPQLQAAWDAAIKPLYEQLPPVYRIEVGGELEGFEDSAGTLFLTLPLFFGLILCTLVAQFNSFRKTAIVGLTVPLAFSGGLYGLLLTGANFDFIGTLGFLSLAGIIINNAIVMIDKIRMELLAGYDNATAIMRASTDRLRPIMITTLTTILGLIPLMMMEETLFYSMASVIIFGLAIGTVMTLGAVPALCMLFLSDLNPQPQADIN